MDISPRDNNLVENKFESDRSYGQTEKQPRKINPQENEIRNFPRSDNHYNISVENANSLRDEMNYRILQVMDGLMKNIITQIQKTISGTINRQVLPQIQITIKHVQGANVDDKNAHAEGLERRSEVLANSQVDKPTLSLRDTLQEKLGVCQYNTLT